jgi:hypothetical protein
MRTEVIEPVEKETGTKIPVKVEMTDDPDVAARWMTEDE